ncbi:hypothetical protein CRE_03708 [Caenorhabditis remanei]|uniref:NTF2-like domain-containing protein n=1 Tax=Caenorhabditis remanei TaxID=31234 RepID=E3LXU5_CAERE|nr:hypothetical protein CRE_03708 [Caenorhabditis remanei]
MWSTFPLLLLLFFVGASFGQPDDPGFHEPFILSNRILRMSVFSDGETLHFLKSMKNSIDSRNETSISELFSPDFEFNGCKRIINKQMIVSLLTRAPSDNKFFYKLKSSDYTENGRMNFHVIIGWNASPVEAEFSLARYKRQLVSGRVSKCEMNQFASQKKPTDWNAYSIARVFFVKALNAIKSQTVERISALFDEKFRLRGCEQAYLKSQVVGKLSHLVRDTPFHWSIVSIRSLSESETELVVEGTAFGYTFLKLELVISRFSSVLIRGRRIECDRRELNGQSQHFLGNQEIENNHFHGLISQESAKKTVTNFLTKLEIAFKSKDTNSITNFFKPSFVFVGCMGTYNREQSIELIQMIPSDSKLNYSYKSVEDLGETIKATVLASGFKSFHVEFEFVLNKKDQQIESARMPDCPKRRFNGVGGAEEKVQKFLGRMARSIESRKSKTISELFQATFIFYGFRGPLNKDEFVASLLQIPSGTNFSITLKSVKKIGPYIKYSVSAAGFGHKPFDSEFILNDESDKLESGIALSCHHGSSKRRDFLPQNQAEVIVKNHLVAASEAVQTRNSIVIGTMFDPNFEFDGCKGNYTKQQVVALLSRIPPGRQFYFAFQYAKFLSPPDKIEYSVIVFGFDSRGIQATFVLNNKTQALISGNITDCQKMRFGGNSDGVQANIHQKLSSQSEIASMYPRTRAQMFLDRLAKAVAKKDEMTFALFQTDFIFKGCDRNYTKLEALRWLGQLPRGIRPRFTIMSTDKMEEMLAISVVVSGFGNPPMEVGLVLNLMSDQLVSGHRLECPDLELH